MWLAIDGMNAADVGERRIDSTSIGTESTFSKYLGFIGLMVECANAATPCACLSNVVN